MALGGVIDTIKGRDYVFQTIGVLCQKLSLLFQNLVYCSKVGLEGSKRGKEAQGKEATLF
jgi:hypothetical protein